MVTAVVNSTTYCVTSAQVVNMDIYYSSLSFTVAVPPLALTKDVSSQVAGKLNTKLPAAAKSLEARINAAALAKLPLCKVE